MFHSISMRLEIWDFVSSHKTFIMLSSLIACKRQSANSQLTCTCLDSWTWNYDLNIWHLIWWCFYNVHTHKNHLKKRQSRNLTSSISQHIPNLAYGPEFKYVTSMLHSVGLCCFTACRKKPDITWTISCRSGP